MLIAGEASGDTLGAELVKALRRIPSCEYAEFFGAGGPKLAGAGVDLAATSVKQSPSEEQSDVDFRTRVDQRRPAQP